MNRNSTMAILMTVALGACDSPDTGRDAPDDDDRSVHEEFVRGDSDANGSVNLTDAVVITRYLFQGGPAPACMDAADANNDGSLNLTDAIAITGALFKGQGPLPEPNTVTGAGPDTGLSLGCVSTPLEPKGFPFAPVAAGSSFTCALVPDEPSPGAFVEGQPMCWGANEHGQVGCGQDCNIVQLPVPTSVLGLTEASVLAAGSTHACAILGSGSKEGLVKCWGSREYGQIGDGTVGSSLLRAPDDPVVGIQVGFPALDLSAGRDHTCAVREDDGTTRAVCWGSNQFGQVGVETTTDTCLGNVPCSPTASVVDLGDRDVTQVVAGDYHSCALLEEGDVECWGSNESAQLGSEIHAPGAPNPCFNKTCLPDGTQCHFGRWDADDHVCRQQWQSCNFNGFCRPNCQQGEVCIRGYVDPESCQCIADDDPGFAEPPIPCSLGCPTEVDNESHLPGEILDQTHVPTPVDFEDRTVVALAAGELHTCALTSSRTVECWGDGFEPGDIFVDFDDVKAVAAGGIGLGAALSCVTTNEGTVVCNTNGAQDHELLGELPEHPAAVAIGHEHGAAYYREPVVCPGNGVSSQICTWGSNLHGQLGDNQPPNDADVPAAPLFP